MTQPTGDVPPSFRAHESDSAGLRATLVDAAAVELPGTGVASVATMVAEGNQGAPVTSRMTAESVRALIAASSASLNEM